MKTESRRMVAVVTLGLAALAAGGWLALRARPAARVPVEDRSRHVVEIRSYNLKPGTCERFHRLFESVSLPMLRRHQVDVVAYGPSTHEPDSYFLMRAYGSLEDRQASEDAFYGSDEWRKGPREAVLADIENYTTVVLPVDAETLRALRTLGPGAAGRPCPAPSASAAP
jgi:hypothetical protein